MILLKKLIFALLFLLTFILLISQLKTLLSSYDFVFALSADSLIQLIKVASLFGFTALFFSLFAAIASDWKLFIPVGMLAAATPLFFLSTGLAIVFSVAILVSLLLTYLSLENTLKTYLTFKATSVLGPAIRQLSTLLILSLSVVYFLSANQLIAQKGFQVPDSLIDSALKMTPLESLSKESNQQAQLPDITPEQIQMLKTNPELLKQYGLDSKILDTLEQPSGSKTTTVLNTDTIKQTVRSQIQNFIKPYINFIPAALALLLFLTLQSLTSILNILIYPVLWLLFFFMEKAGFVKFEVEQRPVKKLLV